MWTTRIRSTFFFLSKLGETTVALLPSGVFFSLIFSSLVFLFSDFFFISGVFFQDEGHAMGTSALTSNGDVARRVEAERR